MRRPATSSIPATRWMPQAEQPHGSVGALPALLGDPPAHRGANAIQTGRLMIWWGAEMSSSYSGFRACRQSSSTFKRAQGGREIVFPRPRTLPNTHPSCLCSACKSRNFLVRQLVGKLSADRRPPLKTPADHPFPADSGFWKKTPCDRAPRRHAPPAAPRQPLPSGLAMRLREAAGRPRSMCCRSHWSPWP